MSRKKKIQTIVAAGMAAFLASALAPPALAEPEGLAGALSPPTGDLVIHKYIGAPIADGDRSGVELTISQPDVLPANGVVFDLYRVGPPVHSTGQADQTNQADQVEAWPTTPPRGTYVKNALTSHLEVYGGTALIGEYELSAADPPTVTTGPNGAGVAGDLPQGFYLVIENAAESTGITDANTGAPLFVSQTAAPFLVAVPMTNPTGDGWLDVVHVYPKSEQLQVDKEVDAAGAVAVGDTVGYTISVSVPGDVAASKRFNISDRLDRALDLTPDSVVVTTLPALTGTEALVEVTDYTVMYDEDSRTLLVTFTGPGRAKLAQVASAVVEFTATVNASMLGAAGLAVPNIAQAAFVNSNDVEYEAESDPGEESTIHTAAIRITKVDQAGQPLTGARFKIATSEANARAGHFLRLDPVTGQLHDFDAAPSSGWSTVGEGNDYEVAPAHVAAFVGLRDAVEVGGETVWQTYWVVETVAPPTFNLLAAPLEVKFADAFAQADEPGDYDYTYELRVANSQGFLLPETGGLGTVVWTVVGVTLLGAAVLLLTTRRRKDANG